MRRPRQCFLFANQHGYCVIASGLEPKEWKEGSSTIGLFQSRRRILFGSPGRVPVRYSLGLRRNDANERVRVDAIRGAAFEVGTFFDNGQTKQRSTIAAYP